MAATSSTAWCGTCRSRQQVMDEYLTDTGDEYAEGASRTRTVVAMPLECGHDANDGGGTPYRSRFRPDPTLVGRLVELQDKARAARADTW